MQNILRDVSRKKYSEISYNMLKYAVKVFRFKAYKSNALQGPLFWKEILVAYF